MCVSLKILQHLYGGGCGDTTAHWVVPKIMGPFWLKIISRNLIFRGTNMGPSFWEVPYCLEGRQVCFDCVSSIDQLHGKYQEEWCSSGANSRNRMSRRGSSSRQKDANAQSLTLCTASLGGILSSFTTNIISNSNRKYIDHE